MAPVDRPLGEGVGGAAPDVGRHLAHPLHQPAAAGRHLRPQPAGRPPGDVLGQVAVAVEVGQHAQDGHQLAPLLDGGVAVHEPLLGQPADPADELVDDLVALDQLLGRLPVPGQQGVGGAGDGLADQREDLDEKAVDLDQGGGRRLPGGDRQQGRGRRAADRVRRCLVRGRLGPAGAAHDPHLLTLTQPPGTVTTPLEGATMGRRRVIGPGTTAVVTGAAGGLGRALVGALAGQGARVVATDAPGVDGVDRVLDVTDPEAARALAAEVSPDVWINNAGLLGPARAIDQPDEEILRVVEVNLLGVVYGTRAAAAAMTARRRGRHLQHRLALGLEPDARARRVRGDQARRARLQRCPGRRAAGHRGARHLPVPRRHLDPHAPARRRHRRGRHVVLGPAAAHPRAGRRRRRPALRAGNAWWPPCRPAGPPWPRPPGCGRLLGAATDRSTERRGRRRQARLGAGGRP